MTITGDIIHREILEITDNRGGSRKIEKKTTVENQRIVEWDVQITGSMADTLIWDGSVATSPSASFDFINLLCDVDIEVEFVSTATARAFVLQLKANSPFTLFSDGTTGGDGATIGDAFADATEVIEKISVREGTAGVANATAGELHIIMSKAA